MGVQPDSTRLVPQVDTTGGPKAKWILRFQDRLILAGIPNNPTQIMISGRWPNQERFDLLAGGGSLLIEPDSGEDITGLGIFYRVQTAQQTVVVFKERSVWEVVIDTTTVGSNTIINPTYRLLTASQGCSSHRSIVAVENDVMFANKRGIYILRYEPQMLYIINANEISAKIRPFFEGLSYADISQSTGFYADKKYILSFPLSQQSVCFDRERLCFLGPWKTPMNIAMWRSYIDTYGIEHWLAASSSDNKIYEFSKTLFDDSGQGMYTQFKTRKEDFGDWTLFKTITEIYMNFRNVTGRIQVNIYIENRQGQVISAKSFTVIGTSSLGTSGMGTDQMGVAGSMGLTKNKGAVIAGELQKKAMIYKTGRTAQIEILTSSAPDRYELLNAKLISIPQARGNSPSLWTV
jgi:hypothetical protein